MRVNGVVPACAIGTSRFLPPCSFETTCFHPDDFSCVMKGMLRKCLFLAPVIAMLAPSSAFAEQAVAIPHSREISSVNAVAYARSPGLAPLALGAPTPTFYSLNEPRTRVRSVGMIVGGSLLTAAGVVATPIGAITTAVAFTAADACVAPGECSGPSTSFKAGALAATILGLAAVGGGITLIVVGATRVPDKPTAAIRLNPQGLGFDGRF